MRKNKTIEYKGFEIILWTDDFCQYFLNKNGSVGNFDFGLIATYVVKREESATLLGFAVGGLDLLAEPDSPRYKQESLVNQAEDTIKRYIDSGQIKRKKQLTFEFHSDNFLPVNKPEWWIKQPAI